MPNHRYIFSLLMLITSNLAIADIVSPSFDCKKASTKIEKAICADTNLAQYDRKLSKLWKSFIVASNDDDFKSRLRKDQALWIKARDTCQTDIACIKNAYQLRLASFGEDKKLYLFAGQYEQKDIGTVTIYPIENNSYLVSIQTADPDQGAWTCEITGTATDEGNQTMRITVGNDSFSARLENSDSVRIDSNSEVFTVAEKSCGLNGGISFTYRSSKNR
jgi:uncharacterized protein